MDTYSINTLITTKVGGRFPQISVFHQSCYPWVWWPAWGACKPAICLQLRSSFMHSSSVVVPITLVVCPTHRVQSPSTLSTCPAQSHRLVQGEEVEVFPRLDKLQCARFQPEGIAKNGLGRSVSVMHGRFHLYQQATHAVLGSCAVAGQCLQLRVNRSVMHHPTDKTTLCYRCCQTCQTGHIGARTRSMGSQPMSTSTSRGEWRICMEPPGMHLQPVAE